MSNYAKGVYIAVLNQGWIRVEVANLINKIGSQHKYNVLVSYPSDKPIANNRNKIVLDFLKRKQYDYLLMLDDDIVPPPNLLNLADFDKDIIGALCFAWKNDAIIPLCLKKIGRDAYTPLNTEEDGLVECDAIGSGAMMIARRVLEHPYWYKTGGPFRNYYRKNGEKRLGLDISFCERAKKLGFRIWAHLDYPASHWTNFDLKKVYETISMYKREFRFLKEKCNSTTQHQKRV